MPRWTWFNRKICLFGGIHRAYLRHRCQRKSNGCAMNNILSFGLEINSHECEKHMFMSLLLRIFCRSNLFVNRQFCLTISSAIETEKKNTSTHDISCILATIGRYAHKRMWCATVRIVQWTAPGTLTQRILLHGHEFAVCTETMYFNCLKRINGCWTERRKIRPNLAACRSLCAFMYFMRKSCVIENRRTSVECDSQRMDCVTFWQR